MSLFDLRHLIIEEYGKYVQSFFSIADERVREFIRTFMAPISRTKLSASEGLNKLLKPPGERGKRIFLKR